MDLSLPHELDLPQDLDLFQDLNLSKNLILLQDLNLPNDLDLPQALNLPQEFSRREVAKKSRRSPIHNIKRKITKRSSKSGLKSAVKAVAKSASVDKKTKPKITHKNQKMHHVIFEEGGLPDNTKLYYKSGGEISASLFEHHAGMSSRKKPYNNIYVSNGVSLHEYASNLKLTCGHHPEENDKLCRVCKQGGDLMPCDGCLRSFHRECIPETSLSLLHGKWFCKHCRSSMKLVGQKAIEQIAQRCIRIVDNPNKCDLVACAICRAYDFNENGFDDRTVIVCDQCEKEYHIGCLREQKIDDLKELPDGKWFCHQTCYQLYCALKLLAACGQFNISDGLMDIIKNKSDNSDSADGVTDLNVKFILIRGKKATTEVQKSLLKEAVEIFHDQFNPIIDSVTGGDFIKSMAYGLTMGASDFSGVHCAMLTKDSKVVTAGLFRVFGRDMIELPIAATRQSYQGKGYFQLFYSCLEKYASYLKIKKFMVPATKEARSMWTNKLGFKKVTPQQLCELRQAQTSMVAFQETYLLEKNVPKSEINYLTSPFCFF